nr:capsid-associated protein Vp91 [Ectropis obliqua nucleopolyhedrovirus]
MQRTNAEIPLPDHLTYVSAVDGPMYTLTTFDTDTMQITKTSIHDDRVEIFDFLLQTLERAAEPYDTRVKAHPSDQHKFQVRGDDDQWFDMECAFNKRFDPQTQRCVPIDFCENKAPGNYALNESMIDTFVLNHNVNKLNIDPDNTHPTMYLRCLQGGFHVIQECPPGNLFDAATSQCVVNNDCEFRPDNYVLGIFSENLAIDQYLMCKNGEITVATCPTNKVFDRRLLTCVDAHPCTINGPGYTYITNEIGNSQYYLCVSSTETELITCLNRIHVDNQYKCGGSVECANFDNGSGTLVTTMENDSIRYNSGVLTCDNYEIVRNIQCDTSNLLADHVYNNRFKVGVHIPRQVYDTSANACQPFDLSLVQQKSKYFNIESLPNEYNINFQTAMIGHMDNINAILGNNIDTNTINDVVTYARHSNAVGLNPIDGTAIECFGATLYDPFNANRMNVCNENNVLIRNIIVADNQYIKTINYTIDDDINYHASCTSQIAMRPNIVEFDQFYVTISSDILRSDVCGTLLYEINDQYTTLVDKYTTIYVQYKFESVKSPLYIDQKHANTYDIPITISRPVNTNNIPPLFDPFEHIETIEPAFNPFKTSDTTINDNFDIANDKQNLIPRNKSDVKILGNNNDVIQNDDIINNVIRDHERTPSPPTFPVRPPPDLTLARKDVSYSCLYAIPTYRFSDCELTTATLVESIRLLRDNVQVDDACKDAVGLANIINSYAYLGNNVGCRSLYEDATIKVVRVSDPVVYDNLDTQSNDGIVYNHYVYKNNNSYLACPIHLFSPTDFTCNIESDKIYYLENMQSIS